MSDLLHSMIQHSHANTLCGENFYDSHGLHAGHSIGNVFGGHEILDGSGHHAGHTMQNIFGGHDLYNAAGMKVAFTSHGPIGEAYHDASGCVTGHSTHHGDIITHTDISGQHAMWHKNLMGGFSTDPLTNMEAIKFPNFIG